MIACNRQALETSKNMPSPCFDAANKKVGAGHNTKFCFHSFNANTYKHHRTQIQVILCNFEEVQYGTNDGGKGDMDAQEGKGENQNFKISPTWFKLTTHTNTPHTPNCPQPQVARSQHRA